MVVVVMLDDGLGRGGRLWRGRLGGGHGGEEEEGERCFHGG